MDLLLPLLIVFMIGMLFMSSRARKKQQTQATSLQNSLGVGDVVVMASGISGTIVDTDDERTIDLEIAPDVVTTWLRASVREKLSSFGADTAEEPEGLADEAGPPALEEPVSGTATPGTPEGTANARADEPSDEFSTEGPSLKKGGS